MPAPAKVSNLISTTGRALSSAKPELTLQPEKLMSVDGNTAALLSSYYFTDVGCIFPITPSTPMAELYDVKVSKADKNFMGVVPECHQMQSEGGVAGALHGMLNSGALAASYTASQGLLLMIPNMYKIAGEMLPGVLHVASRVLGTHSQAIYAQHDDVMATRATGWNMFASASVQEAHDLAAVAHIASQKMRLPVLHFFDGFRTSHEISKINIIDPKTFDMLIDHDAITAFRQNANTPETANQIGLIGNAETMMQHSEALNQYYERAPGIIQDTMDDLAKVTGRQYHLFDYTGHPEAERVVVIMGSGAATCKEAVDKLVRDGEKVGVLQVHVYRPFSAEHFIGALPKSVKHISVLDRTKEAGSCGEPLYLDVCEVIKEKKIDAQVVGGRYGLGGFEFTPAMAKTVFDNLSKPEPMNHFSVGIVDDLTFHSLPLATEKLDAVPEGTKQVQLIGRGADGTVGAAKTAIKLIGDNTELKAQAFFEYDARKSGGVTVTHLRFGPKPIASAYLVESADYVGVHQPDYAESLDVAKGLKPGGAIVFNSPWDTMEKFEAHVPNRTLRTLAEKKARVYNIDATQIAEDVGLSGRINMVMQTCFFYLSNVITFEEAVELLKRDVHKMFERKGQAVIDKNLNAIDATLKGLKELKYDSAKWSALTNEPKVLDPSRPEFVNTMVDAINSRENASLPTSAMTVGRGYPLHTTKYDKRGIAPNVPVWDQEKCIQCNVCAAVCPHQVIRPYLASGEELETLSEETRARLVKAKGKKLKGHQFMIQASTQDCTGCSVCVHQCPADALEMVRYTDEVRGSEIPVYEDLEAHVTPKPDLVDKFSVKGSQFQPKMLEFSGACPGCQETNVLGLITSLFGDRMYYAQASGCAVVTMGTLGMSPFVVNDRNRAVAFGNSLFEDNAEYGYGMAVASSCNRNMLKKNVEDAMAKVDLPEDLKNAFEVWLSVFAKGEQTRTPTNLVQDLLKRADVVALAEKEPIVKAIIANQQHFMAPSIWAIGGDGWAYDIGFGGLDGVLASGMNINIAVLDTEVYSNTGGQRSKAAPRSAVAKFAAAGKATPAKDLGMQMMSYDNVYVAQCCLGADPAQAVKAIKEAEEYDGPSLVIFYTTCIAHGLHEGMGSSTDQAKLYVESGFWPLYRRDPRRVAEGKNPFQLDFKAVDYEKLDSILATENRFTAIDVTAPQNKEPLQSALHQDVIQKFEKYLKLAE